MSKKFKVAVAGATGAVGQEMVRILESRNFPVETLKPLASERSIGKAVEFHGREIPVDVLDKDSFNGLDLAIFSAGAGPSREFAPLAAKAGCVVVDNSSAWRMDPEIPLIVPEVNPHAAARHHGIIANPNCSTIQMVCGFKALIRPGRPEAHRGFHLPGGKRDRDQGHRGTGRPDPGP